jgi:rhamnosyl/mannosyltransferase
MYGRPMISCDIGSGTTYINIDGETGLVTPPADAQALRAAMRTLWDNPEMAREMGLRAAQRFQEVFTSEQMAASYAALYREVVARRAATPGIVAPGVAPGAKTAD